MKRSIKAIAAAAAALALAFSCVPMAYAVEDAPAAQTETEKTEKLEFTTGTSIEMPYKGLAELVSDDGTVYYSGYDKANPRLIIYTLDENGEIKNSYSIDRYTNDKGEEINVGDSALKQCGDRLYLICSEYWQFSRRENVIVELDKELNEISKHRYEKGYSIDTNGEKVVYIKKDKIYLCDMDGKNLKKLYAVDNSDKNAKHEQPLNSVAIAGNYVGFQKRTGYQNEPDYKNYCGIIDIETGEIELHEERSVEQAHSAGGRLIWYGDPSYYTGGEYDGDVPKDAVSADAYWNRHYKYYPTSELYIFDGEEYSVLETPNAKEIGYGTTINSDGDIITTSFDGKGHITYRIYRDKKLIGEHTVSYKGYSGAVMGNGTITVNYTGRDATAEDWIGYDPQTTSYEELQEKLDATPAAKDIMKSVTISYK